MASAIPTAMSEARTAARTTAMTVNMYQQGPGIEPRKEQDMAIVVAMNAVITVEVEMAEEGGMSVALPVASSIVLPL